MKNLDYSKLSCIEIGGIRFGGKNYIEDAFIEYAEYEGRPLTDRELEELNEDYDFVYEKAWEKLH